MHLLGECRSLRGFPQARWEPRMPVPLNCCEANRVEVHGRK
jgi:hypothetical protein